MAEEKMRRYSNLSENQCDSTRVRSNGPLATSLTPASLSPYSMASQTSGPAGASSTSATSRQGTNMLKGFKPTGKLVQQVESVILPPEPARDRSDSSALAGLQFGVDDSDLVSSETTTTYANKKQLIQKACALEIEPPRHQPMVMAQRRKLLQIVDPNTKENVVEQVLKSKEEVLDSSASTKTFSVFPSSKKPLIQERCALEFGQKQQHQPTVKVQRRKMLQILDPNTKENVVEQVLKAKEVAAQHQREQYEEGAMDMPEDPRRKLASRQLATPIPSKKQLAVNVDGKRKYSREFMLEAAKLPSVKVRPEFDTTRWTEDQANDVFELGKHSRYQQSKVPLALQGEQDCVAQDECDELEIEQIPFVSPPAIVESRHVTQAKKLDPEIEAQILAKPWLAEILTGLSKLDEGIAEFEAKFNNAALLCASFSEELNDAILDCASFDSASFASTVGDPYDQESTTEQ